MEAMILSVRGWAWLFWWRWSSRRRPADESWTAGNVSSRRVTSLGGGGVWEGWANISTRRPCCCFEASWSSQCSSGSCRVTLPSQKKRKQEISTEKDCVRLIRWWTTKTHILISELRNYNLQTDVFLLVDLCYCAPIVLLTTSPKPQFRRNSPWIFKIPPK